MIVQKPSVALRQLWLGDLADVTGHAPRMMRDGKRRTPPQLLYDTVDFGDAGGIARFVAALRDQADFCDALVADERLSGAAQSYAATKARTIRQQLAAEGFGAAI